MAQITTGLSLPLDEKRGSRHAVSRVAELALAELDCPTDDPADEIAALLADLPFDFEPVAEASVLETIDAPVSGKTFTAPTPKKAPEALPHKGSRAFGRKGTSVSSHNTPLVSPVSPVVSPKKADGIADAENAKPKRRRPQRLVDPTRPRQPLPGLEDRKLFADFYDLNDAERFALFDIAIAANGDRLAFTLNLRPDREAFYRSKPCAASAILKDLSRHLSREFKRPIDLAIALEETDEKRLHAHGIAGVGQTRPNASGARHGPP